MTETAKNKMQLTLVSLIFYLELLVKALLPS